MKKLFLLLLLATIGTFAQDSFIMKKDGSKIIAENGTLDVIIRDKRIIYKLPGKTWEKYVTFKDLDYAQFGNYIFKSFKIDGKQQAFFVLAQDAEKMLVGLAVTYTTTSGSMSSSRTVYDLYIIDNEGNVIDNTRFNDRMNKKQSELRMLMPEKVKANFPSCTELLKRIEKYQDFDAMNFSVLGFLEDPYFQQCNKN